jgi:hypothetical protein
MNSLRKTAFHTMLRITGIFLFTFTQLKVYAQITYQVDVTGVIWVRPVYLKAPFTSLSVIPKITSVIMLRCSSLPSK